jgi:metallo-beta-lactamase class B
MTEKKISVKSNSKNESHDYLTIDEAIASLKIPEAAAPLLADPGVSPKFPQAFLPPYRSIQPVKLFDNLYFVGTGAVGSLISDTGDGLVMLDTGLGETDMSMMVNDMKKLGLDPAKIKLILISHEHFDHYGGVEYLRKNVCPGAKVGMSLVGWNLLQTVPSEGNYIGSRPQAIDIYLTDGMKIKVGNLVFQIVATPGHSPGCLSFIIPVTDHGEPHVAGVMGGMAVWPTHAETMLYKTSVEYFKAVAKQAKCDVGLLFHSTEKDFAQLRSRKPGDPNPLVIGQENFATKYLDMYRQKYYQMLNSGSLKTN